MPSISVGFYERFQLILFITLFTTLFMTLFTTLLKTMAAYQEYLFLIAQQVTQFFRTLRIFASTAASLNDSGYDRLTLLTSWSVFERTKMMLVEHRTGIARSPRWSLNFFSGFFTQLHKLRSLRRSFLHFISFPQFTYDLFHISLTFISLTGTYEPTIDLLPTSVAS